VDHVKCSYFVNLVLKEASKCFDDMSAEYDVLYGNSGYLYCLLLLRYYCSKYAEYDQLIEQIVFDLIKHGLAFSQSEQFMLIKWPKNRSEDKYYLGGAHGLMGTLQMILLSILQVPSLKTNVQLLEIIKNSCNFVLEQ
jgi:hypothetical protein